MHTRRIFIILLFSILIFSRLSAQWDRAIYNAPVTVPPSPTSSSLGKYGNWPISGYTGTAQISIPLYEVSCGDIKVPVSLSYHGSGLTVEEMGSWTGLGWSLNAGGVITRSVVGAPDEMPKGYANINSRYKGAGLPSTFDVTTNTDDLSKFNDIASGIYDSEPDIISFNFNGHGGRLFLDANNNFTSSNYSQIKITINPLLNYVAGTNRYWEIVDEQGYTYTFGNIDGKEISYVRDGDDGLHLYYKLGSVTTAWYLNQIVSPDKTDTVFFKYSSKMEDYVRKPTTIFRAPKFDLSTGLPAGFGYKTIAGEQYTSHGNCQLSSIEWKFGKLLLTASTDRTDLTGKLLDKISVVNNNAIQSRLFSFTYGYVNGRLFLNQLGINGFGNVQENTYKFEYYSGVPSRFSDSQDYWGYYNGATNANLIPYETIFSQFSTVSTFGTPNANREPNGTYSKAGSLSKIIYPTGGYTLFDYEPNNYYKIGDGLDFSTYATNPKAGGLRIKSVIDYSGNGLVASNRTYEYGAGNSTGTLFSKPKFATYNYQQIYAGCKPPPLGGPYPFDFIVTSSPANLASGNTQGNSVGYSDVTEYYSGGTNGMTTYSYSMFNDEWNDVNFDALYFQLGRPPCVPSTSTDYKRGLLLEQTTFRNNAGTYLKVSKKINTYNYNDNIGGAHFQALKVLKVKRLCDSFYTCIQNPPDFYPSIRKYLYAYGFYNLKTVWPKLISTEDRIYDPSGTNYVSTIKNNFYDNLSHINLTRVESLDSKNKTHKTEYKYPYEMVAQGLDPSGVYQKMINKNIINIPVEQKASVDGAIMERIRQNYSSSWYPDQNIIKPQSVDVENAGGTTEQRLVYNGYDNNGNLQEVSKTGDIHISYIWGYLNSFPVAEVKNAKSNEIYFESFEETGGWDANLTYDNTKSHSGKYSGKIIKTTAGELYSRSTKPITISLTAPTKYRYSGWIFSSGPSVEIYFYMKRAGETGYNTYLDFAYTYEVNKWVYIEKEFTVPADAVTLDVRVDNDGGGTVWYDDIRIHPSVALMTTYTYDPLIGMTSQCDANNKTIYYSYDDIGRLQLIKDQDGKIVKKICYNYAGQTQDCNINVTPAWTATGNLRCVTSGGNNTGYQEREEIDGNPNSPTYSQTQWVANGYNTTACPLPAPPSSFSAASGYSIATSSISSSGNLVSFYIVFSPTSNMDPGNSYFVATINGSCRPSVTRTIPYSSGGRNWTITIYPSGQMYWYLAPGSTSVTSFSTISTSTLTYNL